MKSKSMLNIENVDNSFSKHRRFKSLMFLITCIFVGIYPHFMSKTPSILMIIAISLVILLYGIWVLSKNIRISKDNNFSYQDYLRNIPTLDILVAARDEQNVISRLVERLFNLDYPSEKLKIYIIDDGSVDNTPIILKKLSQKYEKLNIISRSKNAGGG